ncbi:MAG: NACHT domain-containing protein [Candidatus Electrothrix sp. GW3-4]|uniref:NACHT domain-containing protein n=1 Tax=Candidatus Electrothrix sp. GW3-4 TaxID=3126740 RepID=UPI0030CC7C89
MDLLEQIITGLRWLKDNPEVTWSGIGTTLLVSACSWLYARLRKPDASSGTHHADEWLTRNRHKLISRLQWELKDRQQSFLLGRTSLDLDKSMDPNRVSRPYCIWQRDGVPVKNMGQPIVNLFLHPEVNEQLAILGKPGSGKTVCLLKLLEHLLQKAEDNPALPLPVVFECSEWDGSKLPLWLAAQLQLDRRYSFPKDTALRAVREQDILPLFDGLDELATEQQGDFVRGFNAFAENRPLALCCRKQEYDHLLNNAGEKLALRNAAILHDINPQRLREHLLREGLDDLWTLLEQSEHEAEPSSTESAEEEQNEEHQQALLQLARRPLFLGLMIEVSEDLCQGSGRQPGETWEDFLWRQYLDNWLAPNPPPRLRSPDGYAGKYSKEQSLHWLHCLARWMQSENTVALQIDELQPSILKGYWRFGLLYGLFYALAFGLMFSLYDGPRLGAVAGLAAWLLYGLPGCLPRQWLTKIKIITGLSWGGFGLLAYGPVFGLMLGLVFMLIAHNEQIWIYPLNSVRFPAFFRVVDRSFALAFGLLLGLVFGLIQAGIFDPWLLLAFTSALGLGLILLVGMAEGLRMVGNRLRRTVRIQDRLNEAKLSSLLLLPLFLLAAMLVFVQVLLLAEEQGIAVSPFFTLRNLYLVLFMAGIGSFFLLGTNEVLQHYLLRLCLWQEKQLPLRLVPWLAAVHQRKVLQRAGGSYHFLHKQLQEYLAKQQAL